MIDMLVGFVAIAAVFGAYFVPSFIAWKRGHHQGPTIMFINLFLGWTGIGWLIAAAMALSAVRDDAYTTG